MNPDQIFEVEGCFRMPAFAYKGRPLVNIVPELSDYLQTIVESQEDIEIKFEKRDGHVSAVRICEWESKHPELVKIPKKAAGAPSGSLPRTEEAYPIYADHENGRLFVRFSKDDEKYTKIEQAIDNYPIVPVTAVEKGTPHKC